MEPTESARYRRCARAHCGFGVVCVCRCHWFSVRAMPRPGGKHTRWRWHRIRFRRPSCSSAARSEPCSRSCCPALARSTDPPPRAPLRAESRAASSLRSQLRCRCYWRGEHMNVNELQGAMAMALSCRTVQSEALHCARVRHRAGRHVLPGCTHTHAVRVDRWAEATGGTGCRSMAARSTIIVGWV